jgi:hypothetical protein
MSDQTTPETNALYAQLLAENPGNYIYLEEFLELARKLERERFVAIEKHRLAVIHWQIGVAKMERERDEARAELAEWTDSAKNVRKEYDDEHHCSCVAILRKLLKDAEQERDEAREQVNHYRDKLDLLPIKWDI